MAATWRRHGMAKRKADVAFEFSINSTCLTTASTTLTSRRKEFAQEYSNNFARMVEVLAESSSRAASSSCGGPQTASPTHATAPARPPTDPEVFGWAAAQVVTAMNATHQLGGETMSCGAVARAMKPC